MTFGIFRLGLGARLHTGANPQGIRHVLSMRHLRHNYLHGYTPELFDLLIRHRECQASDPSDEVYALIGSSRSADEPGLRAEYSLTPAVVYKRVGLHILFSSKSLHLLSAVANEESSMQHLLPSWVPDWTHLFQKMPHSKVSKIFHASGDNVVSTSYSGVNHNILILKGRILGSVHKTLNQRKLADPMEQGRTPQGDDSSNGRLAALVRQVLGSVHKILNVKRLINFIEHGRKPQEDDSSSGGFMALARAGGER